MEGLSTKEIKLKREREEKELERKRKEKEREKKLREEKLKKMRQEEKKKLKKKRKELKKKYNFSEKKHKKEKKEEIIIESIDDEEYKSFLDIKEDENNTQTSLPSNKNENITSLQDNYVTANSKKEILDQKSDYSNMVSDSPNEESFCQEEQICIEIDTNNLIHSLESLTINRAKRPNRTHKPSRKIFIDRLERKELELSRKREQFEKYLVCTRNDQDITTEPKEEVPIISETKPKISQIRPPGFDRNTIMELQNSSLFKKKL